MHFLPEGHTDFIIAAYSEEFGLIGVLILVILYSAIIFRTFQIGLQSFHNYGRLVAGAFGLSFCLCICKRRNGQWYFTCSGCSLPFMSYGGTAIITLMATFGLVMSIHTHR